MGACMSAGPVPEGMNYIVGAWQNDLMTLEIEKNGHLHIRYELMGKKREHISKIVMYDEERMRFQTSVFGQRDMYRIDKKPETDPSTGKTVIKMNGFFLTQATVGAPAPSPATTYEYTTRTPAESASIAAGAASSSSAASTPKPAAVAVAAP